MPGFFARRKILKKLNFLEMHPRHNCGFRREDDGKVVLLIPKFRSAVMKKIVLGKRQPHFHIHLDENGTEVWLQIDGKKNVGDICEQLKDKLGGDMDAVLQRVTKFLTTLYEARYISYTELDKPSRA